MNKISVAIPTLGRDTLAATLRSLERQTVTPDEVLIINQGPPEAESAFPADLPTKWIHQDVKGVARARNGALRAFAGDWVLFTDDDQEVAVDWVEQLTLLKAAYPMASIIGGSVLPPISYNRETEFVSQLFIPGEIEVTADNYLTQHDESSLVLDVWGGNYALSRECVEAVGLYDEAFGRGSGFLRAGEDTDYMMRVISAGLTGLLSCRLIVFHTYGLRAHGPENTDELYEMAAAFHWKAAQPNSPIRSEFAQRMVPFGKKKASLARITGGRVFGDHAHRQQVYDAMMAQLVRDWELAGGALKRKGT